MEMNKSKVGIKSEAHPQQTLSHFYKKIEGKTGLISAAVPDLTQFLIEILLRRMTYFAAKAVIAQLPRLLQESLIEIEPGPDPSVTLERIIRELGIRFHFNESESRSILQRFYSGIVDVINVEKLKNLQPQLSEEFRIFFELLNDQKEKKTNMKLSSDAFSEGSEIPREFTGEGADQSPPLSWSSAPVGTKEFALICEDPDATEKNPWVHWILYHVPFSTTKIPEGFPPVPKVEVPVRGTQGLNSFGNIGYEGPMPPLGHGEHHYYFRLYALDREIQLAPGATKQQLLHEMRGHILSEATLMGRYQRGVMKRAA